MVYNGKPYLNGWFGGKPTIFGNTQFNNFLGISAQGNEAEATPLVRQVSVDASDGPSDLVLPEDNEQEMPEKQAPVETPKKKQNGWKGEKDWWWMLHVDLRRLGSKIHFFFCDLCIEEN